MYILLAITLIYIGFMLYYRFKRPPHGINAYDASYEVSPDNLDFLYDLTRYERQKALPRQKIFDAIISEIKNARNYILLDVFLFNAQKFNPARHIKTTDKVINELKKKNIPKYFIVDPLNSSYRTDWPETFNKLRNSGVEIIQTDLDKLPDNNLLYSAFWRMFLQWFGTDGKGLLSNPMKNYKKITVRAILKGLNAKANHRKILLCDNTCIISSSNLHDASSLYSNTGIRIRSAEVTRHFLEAEKAVAKMSGVDIRLDQEQIPKDFSSKRHNAKVRPLMGKDIKKWIIRDLKKASLEAHIHIGMLFIADQEIIDILKERAEKGQKITLILDNNRVSFHRKKLGLPNKYIAPKLEKSGINIRFFNDKLNEYHSKYIFINDKSENIIHIGSANLTRRSLLGTNLENNVRVHGLPDDKIFRQIKDYIKQVNQDRYSHKQKEKPKLYHLVKSWVWFAEKTGLASW